ncbi:MAG: response regulator [Promethearchaeota archaeon]
MSTEKTTILIVDDEEDTLEMFSTILEHECFTIWNAINGNQALEQVKKSPDLILLDIRMPGLYGLDLCRQLKEDNRYKHIPIIFLSAKVLTHDIEFGLEAGAFILYD